MQQLFRFLGRMEPDDDLLCFCNVRCNVLVQTFRSNMLPLSSG
jgi:hypothetical protein